MFAASLGWFLLTRLNVWMVFLAEWRIRWWIWWESAFAEASRRVWRVYRSPVYSGWFRFLGVLQGQLRNELWPTTTSARKHSGRILGMSKAGKERKFEKWIDTMSKQANPCKGEFSSGSTFDHHLDEICSWYTFDLSGINSNLHAFLGRLGIQERSPKGLLLFHVLWGSLR